MLDRGERCLARPGPVVAGRVPLVCATTRAIILQPEAVFRWRSGVVTELNKRFGLSRQEVQNVPFNGTKHDIVWRLLTRINYSAYCDHFKSISYSFRRAHL